MEIVTAIFVLSLPLRFTPSDQQGMWTQVSEASMIQSGLRDQYGKLQKRAKYQYVDPYISKTQQQILANAFIVFRSVQQQQITYSWSF